MKHPKWKKIYEYAASGEATSGLEEHLKDCVRCKAEIERIKRLLEVLEQTEELRDERTNRIIDGAWYDQEPKWAIGLDMRLKWVLAPLALALVIGVTAWLILTESHVREVSVLEKPWGFLAQGQMAAKEIGLDDVKLDFSKLEQSGEEVKLEDLGVELPDESILPEVTSSYIAEVLEIEDVGDLMKELGIKDTEGQTRYGRVT